MEEVIGNRAPTSDIKITNFPRARSFFPLPFLKKKKKKKEKGKKKRKKKDDSLFSGYSSCVASLKQKPPEMLI